MEQTLNILTTVFYFVITIGILVFIHEFGHFAAAKLTGMRVDRFSIGFPPRVFGKRVGDTDYCVSLIPIGGYVKIAGMIDESFDTEFLKSEAQPWEFRAKPMWARMFVISAGVVMNILLAILIFWGINFAYGKYLWQTTEVGFVMEGSVADRATIRPGDRITTINHKPVTYWQEVLSFAYVENLGSDVTVQLERNGNLETLSIERSSIPEPSMEGFGIAPKYLASVVHTVEPGRSAEALGLQRGDAIVALNDTLVFTHSRVVQIIQASVGKELKIEWQREGEILSGVTTPGEDGRIGITIGSEYTGPVTHMRYNLLEALPEGAKDIAAASQLFLKAIWQVMTGKVPLSESIGGPIKIAQIATQTAEFGIGSFLGFMALLSMSLAILNILPFPALDGGHLTFLLYEAVFRREIPHRVKLALQQAGFFLLLAFMVFIIYNDIANF
ncbi:MAG: RIP metalloprotease RseP [Bacteroidota bacterium]